VAEPNGNPMVHPLSNRHSMGRPKARQRGIITEFMWSPFFILLFSDIVARIAQSEQESPESV
jgi:hypothetical protein